MIIKSETPTVIHIRRNWFTNLLSCAVIICAAGVIYDEVTGHRSYGYEINIHDKQIKDLQKRMKEAEHQISIQNETLKNNGFIFSS